jgi:hypothetical protein
MPVWTDTSSCGPTVSPLEPANATPLRLGSAASTAIVTAAQMHRHAARLDLVRSNPVIRAASTPSEDCREPPVSACVRSRVYRVAGRKT